jgi:hypothetical protein
MAIGMAAQCREWWRRRTPRNPCRSAARRVLSVAARTLFDGAPMPFRGARRGRRTGVSSKVSWNDAGLSAQGRAVPAQ